MQATAELEKAYSHWRQVRADGNCYYRAFYVGYIENILLNEDDD